MKYDEGTSITGGSGPAIPEPSPIKGKEDVYPYVIADIHKRVALGKERYGTTLQTFNGRNPLWDAYQEAIDLVLYLRQALLEQESGD